MKKKAVILAAAGFLIINWASVFANTSFFTENEPSISDLHREAIRYAEVAPEKIKLWRKQAAAKAFFPKLGLEVGRNVSDLWHWETGSTTRCQDDSLVRGRDVIEWSASFSWDLGELIWNPDQTTIDSRSRLMVQLRDNILNNINKLYFDRLRIKAELAAIAIEDKKRRIEKEIKLQELAASLDGLTGGYFSRNFKKQP